MTPCDNEIHRRFVARTPKRAGLARSRAGFIANCKRPGSCSVYRAPTSIGNSSNQADGTDRPPFRDQVQEQVAQSPVIGRGRENGAYTSYSPRHLEPHAFPSTRLIRRQTGSGGAGRDTQVVAELACRSERSGTPPRASAGCRTVAIRRLGESICHGLGRRFERALTSSRRSLRVLAFASRETTIDMSECGSVKPLR
jgi:hypothetical protein